MKPLQGLLVVALEQALAAPVASCRLADAGARVIKLERPGGDFARHYDAVVHGESTYFTWANRGKESLVVDLKEPEDAALLARILAQADVFIQNLAPGAAERLGFGSNALRARHPRLITCDISGYGEGAYRDMKAYDFLVQCESGLVATSGTPEAMGRIGVSICDIGTGINAYAGILEALLLRGRTGRGSGIHVSLFDSAAEWMAVPLAHYELGAGAPPRPGLHHPNIAPYGAFATADGAQVVIAIQNEREWARFCADVLQQPALAGEARFASNAARVAHRPVLHAAIEQVFATLTREALIARLRAAAIAFGAVNDLAALARHPQLRRWPMPVGDQVAQIMAPPVMGDHDDGAYRPVPALDEHGAAIRAEFAVQSRE